MNSGYVEKFISNIVKNANVTSVTVTNDARNDRNTVAFQSRAGDWVGYPIYYCKTQSLGGSFTMHDPNLWAQLNYASTQNQWAWVH